MRAAARKTSRFLAPIVVVALILSGVPLPSSISDLQLRTVPSVALAAVTGTTTRVSVDSSGVQANAESREVLSISADGRHVLFDSTASNLVPGDTNGVRDVFIRDRQAGTTRRISVGSAGEQANGASSAGTISADGRFASFTSAATNLVTGDSNARDDLFVHELATGLTGRVSVSTTGEQGNNSSFTGHLSSDGRYVVFLSFATNFDLQGRFGIFVRDRSAGTTTLAIEGSIATRDVSEDARFIVVATSGALVPQDTNQQLDVYLHDRTTGTTSLVSRTSTGASGNAGSDGGSISSDGSLVAFHSNASDLVTGDTNGTTDAFVYEVATQTMSRVSLAASGEQANGASVFPALSGSGRFVAFESSATNLVAGDTNGQRDAFVVDRQTGEVTLVSVATDGTLADSLSQRPRLSSDGQVTAFASFASNLVPGDTNAVRDVFAHARSAPDFGAAHAYTFGTDANGAYSRDPVNLATGVFTAHAGDLVLPGRILGLAFTRWYNSADLTTGPLGPAWTHTYNWKLTDNGPTVEIRLGDGRRDTFTRNPDGTYANPSDVFDTLTKNPDLSFTLTLTTQVKCEFSSVGRLERIREPAGNQIALSYTGSNLTTIADTVGRQVTLGYDASNRLTQIQDGVGRRVTYAYDPSGRLVTVTDRLGNATGQDPALHRWQYAYDGASQHMTTITDPDGRVRVRNTYDPSGRVTEQRDGLNALTSISYGSGQTTLTGPRGHQTTYTFDARMRVLTQTDVVGGQTLTLTFTYDAVGNRTTVTDRRGKRTDFTYDSRGNVTSKTDPSPDGVAPRLLTTFTYDVKNNLTQVVDAAGFSTTLDYDATTNVLVRVSRQIQGATSAVTTYDYADPANPGLPTRIVAPRANTGGTPDPTYATVLAYDAQGNLTTRTDPDGARTTFAYDAVGRLVSFVDPDGNAPGGVPAEHTWTIAYDELDRETRRTDPLGNALRYAYDGAGNRTSLTDRSGNVTSYAYDANARLSTVQQKPDPLGNPGLVYTTQVTRDASGNATRITQGNGVPTDYAYDALERLTSVTTHPDPQTNLTTSYTLDGNGQPTGRTTADGVTVSYGYDGLSRLTSVSATGLSITYAYDAVGRRTAMTDSTGTTTYQYDGLGRLTQVAAPNGTLTYAYDLDGNRTTLGYPGSQNVTYTHSAGGRLSQVSDWAGRLSNYSYLASGLVSAVTYPNGMRTDHVYDRAQRLTRITNSRSGVTLTDHAYTLDGEGNRTALDEFVQGLTAPALTWSASARVNDDTGTSQQERPAIAVANDGAAYLIWDDYRAGSHADIFFARRDPATGTWSANQKVNDDATVRTQWNAALALDASDNAYAVWMDQREGNKTPETNIYSSKRSAASGTWSANARVNDDTRAASQIDPRISVGTDGSATAVWVDYRDRGTNIFSSTLASGATTWGANAKVTNNGTSRKGLPDIAWRGTVTGGIDGRAVWEDDRNGNFDIYSTVFDCEWVAPEPPGCRWDTTNFNVSDDSGSAAQYYARIVPEPDGGSVVFWLDDRAGSTQVRMRRSPFQSPSQVISDAGAAPVALAASASPDGRIFVVWQDARGTSYDIWGTQYDPATQTWSTPSRIDDDPGSAHQLRPTVAFRGSELAVAWRDDRSGDPDVRARTRRESQGIDRYTNSYDGLNRLSRSLLTRSSGTANDEAFTSDAATNIASRTSPAASYTYDQSNRVSSDGTQGFLWSAADRLIQRGADTFAYDPLSRMTGSTVAGTSRIYAYDGDGLLASRTQGAATTTFLWDVATAPAPLLTAGTDRLVHGLGPLYVARPDGSTLSLVRDALGSVRAAVNDSGIPTETFRYAAYGTVLEAAPPGFTPTLLGYAGELTDLSGLIYLRSRWYDPVSGRFMTKDHFPGTARLPVSLNGYPYAHGSPVVLTDPNGDCPPCLLGAIAAGAKLGLLISDVIGTAETLLDPAAGKGEKAIVTVFFLAGLLGSSGQASVARAGFQAARSAGVAGKITRYSSHALDQAISREGHGVAPRAILDAVKYPREVIEQSGGTTKYVGRDAIVVLRGDGTVVTVIATHRTGFRFGPE